MAKVAEAGSARVAAFIADQPKGQRDLLLACQALLDEGLPGATCAIKWGVPVWTGNANVAGLMPYPDRVNLALFRGARLADPRGLLQGTGKDMRHVRLAAVRDLKDPAVKALVRQAWRLDQA